MDLPQEYCILPHLVDFHIPGFAADRVPGTSVLAPEAVDSCTWFHHFESRISAAVAAGKFLPVMRMSDGEYLFLLGQQWPSRRLPWPVRHYRGVRQWIALNARLRGGFSGHTAPGVSVGRYSREDLMRGRRRYAEVLPWLAARGLLALHLTMGPAPFQEHFHPALGRWLQAQGITITLENYVPFYFVYAMLTGPLRARLWQGRRVLVVHGATGAKKERIIAGLKREGVAQVEWCTISADRSLYDRLDVKKWAGQIDLCLVGGGVGKPNLFAQLEPLSVPCLDAGYVFEVWADPARARERRYTAPDESRAPL